MDYIEMAVTAGLGTLPELKPIPLKYRDLEHPIKRKYFRGIHPCNTCRVSNHTKCTERGCTCSCPIATNDREDKALIAELDAERAADGVSATT